MEAFVVLNVRLSPELYAGLKEYARQKGLSMTKIMNEMLKKHLEEQEAA